MGWIPGTQDLLNAESGKSVVFHAICKGEELTSSQYPWKGAHVLVPLFIGAALIAAFIIWEWVSALSPP